MKVSAAVVRTVTTAPGATAVEMTNHIDPLLRRIGATTDEALRVVAVVADPGAAGDVLRDVVLSLRAEVLPGSATVGEATERTLERLRASA